MAQKTEEKQPKTKFLERYDENDAFTENIHFVCKPLSELEASTLKLMILDLKRQVPTWNFSTALVCLSIAQNTISLEKIRQKVTEKGKGLTRNDTEQMSDLMNQIDKLKKQIGVDPKSASGEGSLSETIADIAKRTKFDYKRFVCKMTLGSIRRDFETDQQESPFENAKDEDVQKYLEKAVSD